MELRELLMALASQLPGRLPILIALVVGLVLVTQRRTLSPASRRAGLLGFGHSVGPCLRPDLLVLDIPIDRSGWPAKRLLSRCGRRIEGFLEFLLDELSLGGIHYHRVTTLKLDRA